MLGSGQDPQEVRVQDAARARVPEQETRKVMRHSVRGQILEALRKALVDGVLVQGEIYSGPALGERFGVSATPVREAMQQLALEGAVECLPNRGFRVLPRTRHELAELAEVRALLELPVILELARTADAGVWAAMRPAAASAEQAAASGDPARYAEADRAFHRAVLALSGNSQLLLVTDDVHRRARWPVSGPTRFPRANLPADAAQHTAMLDALSEGDLPLAESVIRDHFAPPVRPAAGR
ncbi:GntR family transcriptional regulator [Streptomyces sp. NBC_00454]|uniref:GntR family transcriptional regulator n=1 Tax=Streptomyces sp. NBC_00454 TaxID=2975747 RepID=UPI00352DA1B3